MFLNINWEIYHPKYYYQETENSIFITDNFVCDGIPTHDCIHKYIEYSKKYVETFISSAKYNNIHLCFCKNIKYTISLIFNIEHSEYSLLYLYNSGNIQRYKYNSNSMFRCEESDKNNIQYLYPIGSKVKLKFPIDYNITEGIIVSNEEEYINDDDFSNTYKIKVKNKHGEYISLFYPHYMDILESDKNPYKIIKGGNVYEQK